MMIDKWTWVLFSCAGLSLGVGCGDDGSAGAGGAGAGSAGGSGGGGGATVQETCTATFHWLQKDAYKETAGRTSALWPPHTTTLLEVVCVPDGGAEEQVASSFQANHGTEPGAVDANGDVILEDMRQATATGTRAELLDLVAAYEACACEPATSFLSMDSLGDAAVEELVTNLIVYLQQNLTCTSPGGVDALIQNLQNGEIDLVIADLPSCTWAGGTTFEGGLDEALTTLLEQTQEVLSGYHVCNNDALLQANMFEEFAASGDIVACDNTTAVCQGPLWLYEP